MFIVLFISAVSIFYLHEILAAFSARCNIFTVLTVFVCILLSIALPVLANKLVHIYISRLCHGVSVRLSVRLSVCL